jgi:ferric-dicitrate binding protein FerR (iron transport regulator)
LLCIFLASLLAKLAALVPPDRDIMAKATEWVVRLGAADDTEFDQIWAEFDDWFMSDAKHKKAYAIAKRYWDQLNSSCGQPRSDR